jgi:hypothetical protein
MRKWTVLIVLAMLPNTIASAEQGVVRSDQRAKVDAPRLSVKKSNPCAEYGEGFIRVEGSSTCVHIGGSVRVEGGRSTR